MSCNEVPSELHGGRLVVSCKRFETYAGVRTDHCDVGTGYFPNSRCIVHFTDHVLDDRIVDSPFDVSDNEYLVACGLKFPRSSHASKVDIMISWL